MNPSQQAGRPPGLECPDCSYLIPISMDMLLYGRAVYCGKCGLKLTIDQEASAQGLRALSTLKEAMDKAEKLKQEALSKSSPDSTS